MQIDNGKKFTKFFDGHVGARKINFLVLHHVEANSAEQAINMFFEHNVSSHFLIDESGRIFELVAENDIAWHAGVSFWNGCDGLNKFSIGVEFINSSVSLKKFEQPQILAGLELCQYLQKKYSIKNQNIVGHSDIGYSKDSGFLNRKQDPSHLFDWHFFAQNGIGFFPEINLEDKLLFQFGDQDIKISETKKNLKKFGYRVINEDDKFDSEMSCLMRVFNRRFLGCESDLLTLKSQKILEHLLRLSFC